ncbi:MAG TPA: zincin-like metallopeptidase domain-containing protein, partial [Candidatus Competibacteraceae bacterium]|nr:zincin-like metallopeptidase domain-containing protein [Candidatus Competibacteraceae bacterium]
SLHRASGALVVVCFHAGNLPTVAMRLRQRHRTATLVIAGDDDRYTPHNPGRAAAAQAAQAVNGVVLFPDFTGLDVQSRPTDFNDVQVLGGMAALKAQIQNAVTTLLVPSPPRSSDTLGGESPSPNAVREVNEMAATRRRRTPTGGPREPRPGRGGGLSRNHYQEVTDRIIAMIENGAAPWRQPWDRPRAPHVPALPLNAVTGKAYQGINILLLQATGLSFFDPRWCGYEQAKTRGWQVRAGEQGATIYFFKRLEIHDPNDAEAEPLLDEDGRPRRKTIPLLRAHTVFHASQIEGIPTLEEAYGTPATEEVHPTWDREAHLEAILRRSGARIVHTGSLAFYRPAEDAIYLPPLARFPSSGHYYGVAYHELGHWTGHPERLNRPFCFHRDAPEYAREELRAELASAFLGAELGIQYDLESHAAYLDHYLDLLRRDHREIFRAARDAQGIADLVLDRHPTWQLRQGVCVPRTDPLPDEESTLNPIVIPATHPALSSENPGSDPEASGEQGASVPVLPNPYQWAALALQAWEATEEDHSALGRLSRYIDTVWPWPPRSVSPESGSCGSGVSTSPSPLLAPVHGENRLCRRVAPS